MKSVGYTELRVKNKREVLVRNRCPLASAFYQILELFVKDFSFFLKKKLCQSCTSEHLCEETWYFALVSM